MRIEDIELYVHRLRVRIEDLLCTLSLWVESQASSLVLLFDTCIQAQRERKDNNEDLYGKTDDNKVHDHAIAISRGVTSSLVLALEEGNLALHRERDGKRLKEEQDAKTPKTTNRNSGDNASVADPRQRSSTHSCNSNQGNKNDEIHHCMNESKGGALGSYSECIKKGWKLLCEGNEKLEMKCLRRSVHKIRCWVLDACLESKDMCGDALRDTWLLTWVPRKQTR